MSSNITPAKKPSSLANLQTAFARVKSQADKAKETGTMLARELVTTTESSGTAFVVGFCDEVWGKPDALGVRVHKTSDVPTAMGAGFAVKMFAALGAFGEFQRDVFAAGTGSLSAYAATQGRRAAIAYMARQAKTTEKTTEKTAEKKTEKTVAA